MGSIYPFHSQFIFTTLETLSCLTLPILMQLYGSGTAIYFGRHSYYCRISLIYPKNICLSLQMINGGGNVNDDIAQSHIKMSGLSEVIDLFKMCCMKVC